MAIFEDDFESYTLGQTLPFGSWTGGGASITADGPYPSNSKSIRIVNGSATYISVSYQNSISVFFAFQVSSTFGGIELAHLDNGPNAFSNIFTLFHLKVEQDGTLTADIPLTSEVIGNSIDALVRYLTWNFVQINLVLTDVTILGVNYMHMNCHIALNGKEVITRSFDTAVSVAGLTNGTAEVNRFVLTSPGCIYDNFTLDTLQSIVTYPHPGSPKVYVDQGVIELAKAPDSAVVQVMQGVIELGRLPNSAKIQIYQGVIELLLERTVVQGLWKVKEY